jgi:hypothetical protein
MTSMAHAHTSEALGLSKERLEFPDEFVPVINAISRQGDVLPRRIDKAPAGIRLEPVGRKGRTIVQGDNAHILHTLDAGTTVKFAPVEDRYIVGVATVEGGNAYLTHTEEHGSMELEPGTWEFRCPEEATISGFVRVTD